MQRLYLSGEDVSKALLSADIELRPEDCLMTKFWQVAEELSDIARSQVRKELSEFSRTVLR